MTLSYLVGEKAIVLLSRGLRYFLVIITPTWVSWSGGIMLARRNTYCLHAGPLYLAQISLSVRDHKGQPCRCGSWYGWEKYRRCQQNRGGSVEDASLHKQLRSPQWNRTSEKAHGGCRKWDHLTGFRQREKQTFWEWCSSFFSFCLKCHQLFMCAWDLVRYND